MLGGGVRGKPCLLGGLGKKGNCCVFGICHKRQTMAGSWSLGWGAAHGGPLACWHCPMALGLRVDRLVPSLACWMEERQDEVSGTALLVSPGDQVAASRRVFCSCT